MPIYVKFEGITGSVTEENHKEWIQAESFQFGVGRAIATAVGNSTNRESSSPSISEITITKLMDAASPSLFEASLIGTDGKKVEIELTRTGGASGEEMYARYELTNTLVSSYSVSSGGDRPSESLSFNFTKVEYKYIPRPGENTDASALIKMYDMATTKTS